MPRQLLLLSAVTRATTIAVTGAAILFATGQVAHADKGGVPNAHAGAAQGAAQGSAAADHANDHAAGNRGGAVSILGITPAAAGATSSLQITNAGTQSGTATVTIYAADTGAQLATWTTPSIPAEASLLKDISVIASSATPALTSAQASAPVDLVVQSSIHGNVQTLISVSGALSNISTCGPGRHGTVGGVPGPGSTTLNAAVRIGNDGSATAHATLTLYNSTDGTKLGTWKSPDVPAHGSISVTNTAIAAAATPVVSATTASFTLASDPAGLDVLVLVQPKSGGAPTLLNNACPLKGAGAAAAHAAEDAED